MADFEHAPIVQARHPMSKILRSIAMQGQMFSGSAAVEAAFARLTYRMYHPLGVAGGLCFDGAISQNDTESILGEVV